MRCWLSPIIISASLTLFTADVLQAQALPICAQAGEGAALMEGECVTFSASYERRNLDRTADDVSSDSDQFSFAVAGQKAVSGNWYASVSASYSRFDAPLSIVGLEREADRFFLGASISHVERTRLLSASLGVSFTDAEQSSAAAFANTPGRGIRFSNDESTYSVAAALRAAKLFDGGGGYYAKPSVDAGLIYTHTRSRNTTFDIVQFGGDIENNDHVLAFLTPALEVGVDLEYDSFSVRPFVFGGARFLFFEDETRRFEITSPALSLADDQLRFNRSASSGFLGLGAILFASDALTGRMTYTANFQSRVVTHTVVGLLQINF